MKPYEIFVFIVMLALTSFTLVIFMSHKSGARLLEATPEGLVMSRANVGTGFVRMENAEAICYRYGDYISCFKKD